ncbi:ECF sigma factor [Posidoniimonas polymericola]|uniref:ECF sigma factor n=1 Tax=Posidoniimonas polymericola TaxID=2528002 RepID=A0A5C5XVV0_9BACT|nr:ECF-type sigma factor [Posidoniimonas polymericola]TWT67030.1 ECF sigma factor [Posidoniimonas polymericola]
MSSDNDSPSGDLTPEQWEALIYRLSEIARSAMWWMRKGSVDSDQTVSSTLRTYWRQVTEGQRPMLSTSEELWSELRFLLNQKIKAAKDSQKSLKNQAARFSELAPSDDGTSPEGSISSSGLGPKNVDAFLREIDLLFVEVLKDEVQLKVARLKLQGFTNAEIAKDLGLSEHQVQRMVQKIRAALSRSEGSDDG